MFILWVRFVGEGLPNADNELAWYVTINVAARSAR